MSSILVIDDEALFLENISAALRRRGFSTYEAADGRSGAELARRHLPDLVLCDINMRPLDGYQTLDTLRQEPATAGIPFIFMTGMGDTETLRKGMDRGADDFLPKPFTTPQLYNAVDTRLRKYAALRHAAEKKLSDLRASLTLALPHEFITPLNGIYGLGQLLASESANLSPQEVGEFGQNIVQSAERLQRTVQNFLLYGQLEIQATDPERLAALRGGQTSQLRDLIATRARHAASHAARDTDLQLNVGEGSVAMAPDLFTRLADELLDNAFKFSMPGQPVVVTSAAEGGKYSLSITDHGCGMTSEQIANVSAYTQFDRELRAQQGSGLGLAIARRITELHGGEFKIESEANRGTKVSTRLPAVEESIS